MSAAAEHLSAATLLEYWLDDADAATADRVDEHLVRCDACGAALDELVALGAGIGAAFRAGLVPGVLPSAFVDRLAGAGLQVRAYRLPHNGSVNCTVAPDDDLLVAHLAAPLHGVQRLDAVAEMSTRPGVRQRLEDIPFDAEAGEVLYVPPVARIKAMPAHDAEVTLLAVDATGSREIGRYTFHHRPWPGH